MPLDFVGIRSALRWKTGLSKLRFAGIKSGLPLDQLPVRQLIQGAKPKPSAAEP